MATRIAKLRLFIEEEVDHFQLLSHAARRRPQISWAYNRAFVNVTRLLDELDEKMNNIEYTEEQIFREITNELVTYINQVWIDICYKYQEEGIKIPSWTESHIKTLVDAHKNAIKRDLEVPIPSVSVVEAQIQDFNNSKNLEVSVDEPTVQEPDENAIVEYKPVSPVYTFKLPIEKEESSFVTGFLISTGINLVSVATGTALGLGMLKVLSLCGAEISLSMFIGIPVTMAALSLVLSATFQVMYEDGDFESIKF